MSIYCDHCGEGEVVSDVFDCITDMPVDFDSGNAGESAVLCPACMDALLPSMDERKEKYERVDLLKVYGVMPYSVWEMDSPKYSNPIRKHLNETYGNSSREGTLKSFGGAGERTAFTTTTSYFNPALARTVYRSYAPKHGSVFDPFASVVRPYVAMLEGMRYVGCEIREEEAKKIQCSLGGDLFSSRVEVLHTACMDVSSREKFDLIFSCPPYFNLECYSDLQGDISNINNYPAFLVALEQVLKHSIRFLKDDGYFVLVVADFRDYSEGRKLVNRLVPFVADTIKSAQKVGLGLYDKVIIKKPIGTAPARLKMWNNRKTVRVHEELLVLKKN